ncbi:hypothetical protein A1O1_07645 [Capronia coronata CBS 617.96]|uniref:Sucrase/ferredoxin-like family protein n=1 Tax=Capronia coronata CBS 617.96 TaxID=1182541 RepID=W9XX72_9EURO|nr:uncharacterized protein A1O1_07645 [Capronia coronata CBS 617.96]EXJ81581.1 hypothetical protein A1O1_07645 [Capronia coronata CBS 617.96]
MSLLRSVKGFLSNSRADSAYSPDQFRTAKTETDLFPATRPDVDGEECLHDCTSCTTHYPSRFSVDQSDKLYGHVKGWNTHLIVGTGKTDWVRDVTDEKGSVMQAVGKAGVDRKNGKLMLSASNLPPRINWDTDPDGGYPGEEPGTSDCLLLPAWVVIEKVAPSKVERLLRDVVEKSVTNTTPLRRKTAVNGHENGYGTTKQAESEEKQQNGLEHQYDNDGTSDASKLHVQDQHSSDSLEPQTIPACVSSSFNVRPIPYDYLILMCSHRTRDARCGQSAPLLRKEFERILRPMGLYRDMHDDRPGGVGIYFINHVGGHKYSANVLIYRREGRKKDNSDEDIDGAPLAKEAVQMIWLARVRPEDCENIVRYTILQGKLVKPLRQLRAGFDREKGLVSW